MVELLIPKPQRLRWARPSTETAQETLCFSDVFQNTNPVEIEIGCGKGKFLMHRAENVPNVNFIGLDYAGKWMKIGFARSQKRNLDNLRFIKTDALSFVQTVPRESVNAFHIYFPDPWPKRRHQRRRLLTVSFFEMLYDRLFFQGLLEIATDNKVYFEAIREAVHLKDRGWASMSESVNHRFFDAHAKTNYETKYEAEGRPLYYLELRK